MTQMRMAQDAKLPKSKAHHPIELARLTFLEPNTNVLVKLQAFVKWLDEDDGLLYVERSGKRCSFMWGDSTGAMLELDSRKAEWNTSSPQLEAVEVLNAAAVRFFFLLDN